VAVKQVTEFTVFGRDGASIRVLLEAENRLSEALIPTQRRIDVFGTDFFVQTGEIAFGAWKNPNDVCHAWLQTL